MKKDNKGIKITALASGAALIGAFGTANASELLNFEDLGSGSELRSSIITADAINSFTLNSEIEFECGEGKCGEGKCGGKDKKKEAKADDGKSKAAAKSEGKSDSKGSSMEMKPAESAPADKPAAKPADKKKAAKAVESPKN